MARPKKVPVVRLNQVETYARARRIPMVTLDHAEIVASVAKEAGIKVVTSDMKDGSGVYGRIYRIPREMMFVVNLMDTNETLPKS